MAVHVEPGGDLWGRLRHWLAESITALDRRDYSRLPESFARDPQLARQSYETVLMAMDILESGSLTARD